jgi:elongation factor P hydroxylase
LVYIGWRGAWRSAVESVKYGCGDNLLKEESMSKTMKALLATAALFAFSVSAYADNPKGEMKADAQEINAACKTDASNTGCGGEVVGKGLLKCMHAYKQAHKDYKFSEGCRDAMKKMKEDRQEMKGGKKD